MQMKILVITLAGLSLGAWTMPVAEDVKGAGQGPAYYSWILGNPADVTTATEGVSMIQGGGTDVDNAMRWMLTKSGGGDIVVIRDGKDTTKPTPTADAYNPYFYSQLGVKVDSVETIYLNSRSVATNPDVVQTVRNAECLFFTGGDQSFYYNYIVGTPLQDAINYLKTVKKVPVGGTSAGCAIMGEYVYTAEKDSVESRDALLNPYMDSITLATNFFKTPFLEDTVTDTHYSQRQRHGRQAVFMARLSADFRVNLPSGIGLDEQAAIAIDATGKAWVYGSGTAYFIIQYHSGYYPEQCVPKRALDWYRNRSALQVYKIAGTTSGSNYFDLSTWDKATGAVEEFWYVDDGDFYERPSNK